MREPLAKAEPACVLLPPLRSDSHYRKKNRYWILRSLREELKSRKLHERGLIEFRAFQLRFQAQQRAATSSKNYRCIVDAPTKKIKFTSILPDMRAGLFSHPDPSLVTRIMLVPVAGPSANGVAAAVATDSLGVGVQDIAMFASEDVRHKLFAMRLQSARRDVKERDSAPAARTRFAAVREPHNGRAQGFGRHAEEVHQDFRLRRGGFDDVVFRVYRGRLGLELLFGDNRRRINAADFSVDLSEIKF
ncbi:hypothetical protein C8R45DRAFT_1081727 [Mycena sanguinolenta]|nr:hypothetical protein C8R45DRAFT_1081727 [Mycena sanguinolenta]